MEELSHFIDGARVAGTSGRFADVFNPATGEVQARVPLASREELDAAVARAAEAQVAWGATNPQRRARVMMEFVHLLNRDMDKLAEALSREHGKTIPDAKGDVQRGMEVIERRIMPEELESFEQCWLTGTAAEVTPVGQIGDYNFEVGALCRDVAEDYEKLVRS